MSATTAEPIEITVLREQGWGRVVFAAICFLLVPLTPLFRVLLPTEQTALLMAPALAGLAVAGWISGGRAALAIVWVAVATWSVVQLSGGGLFSLMQGGWAVLVTASFGAVVVVRRNAAAHFLPRALAAIALSMGLAITLTVVVPGGPTRVADGVAAEAGRRAEESRASWRLVTGSPEWKEFVAENAAAGEMAEMVDAQLGALPVTSRVLFPSLAALEALAALALAWALYHRLGRARLGLPLTAIRDFRFNDHMVWGVIAGLAMVLIPGLTLVRTIGANLLMFFGALYTIRGVGVFLWMASPGRLSTALLVVVSLLFWNVLGVLALGLGIGDTWLDWRSRARPKKS
ncbi:MAG: DUF2232 domain-containing protein [Gemmatimonadetes bacterium]|nr:DUF2232 domain-containing protein [Gemmatimonadota bacterium]